MKAKQAGHLMMSLFPITQTTTVRSVVVMLDQLIDEADDGLVRRTTINSLINWIECHSIDDEFFVDFVNRVYEGPNCWQGL